MARSGGFTLTLLFSATWKAIPATLRYLFTPFRASVAQGKLSSLSRLLSVSRDERKYLRWLRRCCLFQVVIDMFVYKLISGAGILPDSQNHYHEEDKHKQRGIFNSYGRF